MRIKLLVIFFPVPYAVSNLMNLFLRLGTYMFLRIIDIHVFTGYDVDTPTTEHIKKQYGANACAGCIAVGIDTGVGIYGDVAADTTAEPEV